MKETTDRLNKNRRRTEERFFKKDLVKPDGRPMSIYSRRPLSGDIQATNPVHDPIMSMPHLRWQPMRGEWVAYASHRQDRTFLPPKEYNPLAPSDSKEFPTELPKGDYDIAVFENLFSSLNPKSNQSPDLYVPTTPADGTTEVVVFCQSAEGSLGQLPLDHIELLLKVWADRTNELTKSGKVKYVLPFENRGVEVGVTLHHPHGQIYAYPFVPPIPARMQKMQKNYFDEHRRGLLADILERERSDQLRMIVEESDASAFIPSFARYPYEVWVTPHRSVPDLSSLAEHEIVSLAATIKAVLLKFDAMWGRPFPYLMALYQAPFDGKPHPEFHFHIEFYPPYRSRDRLKFLAGTELAAGMFVNDSLPEEKAAELRAVEVQLN